MTIPRPRLVTLGCALLVAAGVVSAAPAAARLAPSHDAHPPAPAAPARPAAPGPAAGAASGAPAGLATTATTAAAVAPAAGQPRQVLADSLACEVLRGLRLCTHGDDAHLAGAQTARGGTSGSSSSTASTRIGCYSTGPRVQAVYARPATAPDRYSAALPSFRGWAGAVERTVDDSAHKTRGARHVRFASVPSGDSCTLSVLRVTLPANAFGSFSTTVSALQDLGLDDAGVKYLVWADAKGYCGIASAYQDDSASSDNLNNGRYPSYARIDRTCWGKAEAHELLHMLGAVQQGAPHSTQGMHCHDGRDVMCYDDGTRGSRQQQVCPAEQSRLLDCRGDDYFNTAPARGSWLAGHWNTAFSAFLAPGWTDPPRPRPAPTTQTAAPASPAPAEPSPSPSPSPSPTRGGLLPLVLPTWPAGR